MKQQNLHQLIFQAAKEILAEGKYPTIELICEKLKLNPTQIKTILQESSQPEINVKATHTKQVESEIELQPEEKEMLQALTILARLNVNSEDNNHNHQQKNISDSEVLDDDQAQMPDHVAQMAARVDKKAQYMAGGELVLTQQLYRYYREVQDFSEPEVQQQVEAAMQETENVWEDDIQNFSPAAMLKKYAK